MCIPNVIPHSATSHLRPPYALLRYISLRDTVNVAALASFCESQAKEHPIYDGRHPLDRGVNMNTLAMPASLYHPIFQRWRQRAADPSFDPLPRVVAATAGLMEAASVLYESRNSLTSCIQLRVFRNL